MRRIEPRKTSGVYALCVRGGIDSAQEDRSHLDLWSPTGGQFHDYEFNIYTGHLFRSGRRVRLEPKVSTFISAMIAGGGRTLSRETLRNVLWPDGGGSNDSLNYIASAARRAFGGSGSRVIVCCRGRGYRLGISPKVKETTEEPTLIERARDLARLQRLHNQVQATHAGKLVFVTGPPGGGKTALLRRFVQSTAARIHWARCFPPRTDVARAPWLEVLAQLCCTNHLEPALNPLSYVRLVKEVLSSHAHATGLVIVIEDLHQADDATLGAFEIVHHQTLDCPVLLIGSCRTPLPQSVATGSIPSRGTPMSSLC